jgi:ABC-type multidrug transport system ATPase subunit
MLISQDMILEKNPDGIRSNIGIIFQDPSLDIGLTGRENLNFHAMMYNISSCERKKGSGKCLMLLVWLIKLIFLLRIIRAE